MAKFPFTRQQIINWGGVTLYIEAEKRYYRAGAVSNINFDGKTATGIINHGSTQTKTSFSVSSSGIIESHCLCAINREYGRICQHVIALAIALMHRESSPEKEALKARELEHAKRMEQAIRNRTLAVRSENGQPADFRIRLPKDWHSQFQEGRINIECVASIPGGGTNISLEYLVQRKVPLKLNRDNEIILTVLEDICEGVISNPISVNKTDFFSIVEMLSAKNRPLYLSGGNPIVIEKTPLESVLTLDLDRESGELLMFLNTDVPNAREGDIPDYIVFNNKGWAHFKGHLWPLKSVLPGPYQTVYSETIAISRADTIKFLNYELKNIQKLFNVNIEFPTEQIVQKPSIPKLSLRIKGTTASIAMTLYAKYGTTPNETMIPAAGSVASSFISIPDPTDLLTYYTRNIIFERNAIQKLNSYQVQGETGSSLSPIVGERNVLNFIGSVIPALRRAGWKVIMDEKLDNFVNDQYNVIPVVSVTPEVVPGYFDVSYTFYSSELDTSIPDVEVQRAITKGDAFIKNGNKITFIDKEAIEMMRSVFDDCASGMGEKAGAFRVKNVYAPYIQSSVAALDGSDIDAPPSWYENAKAQNRLVEMQDVTIDEPLNSTLRPYQKQGVSWFRFLEANRFGGILADEMGLGKTLQTLSWISMQRMHDEHFDKPAMVICPTSLVQNWIHEAAKFVPHLKTIAVSGASRKSLFGEKLMQADIIITSYALIRRDIDEYKDMTFSAVILDEAQNIKNRTTQNALAVKNLSSGTHIVLTGTPVENSVADLWSIMDFVMPQYLGDYKSFKENYETPISLPSDNPLAEQAKIKLRRKLHPFMLRRKKIDVAKDLPNKIEKVSWCTLSEEQQKVYDLFYNKYRDEIKSMVKDKGFDKSRMEILSILLRLRQICCHLKLIEEINPIKDAKESSAKLEQFFEFFDQAVSDGHRILVFSQFVKMLHILRDSLAERGIKFCYLDGASRDRMENVIRFNNDPSIPIFLISLKAGGTGLNLTGADTVIHFDPWWNPAIEDQATDRAHRIGQKKTVYSLKLITSGTIEEKVLAMQNKKRAIIGATIESDESTMDKLTWDDVRELFNI